MAKNFWQKLSAACGSASGGNKPILALAPMAGISDSAFRQLCKFYGADVVYTEMISADALHYGSKKTLEMLKFDKSEKPAVCQLFGKRPEMFKKACELAEKTGYSGIDLNFGCPARKVVAHGGGVVLMRDLDFCRQMIIKAAQSTKLPVSVKIRAGIDRVTAMDFVKAIAGLPVSAIMVHGRYFSNPFGGPVDFAMIKKVKENFKGIVLGNGGINRPEDGKYMIEQTGIDGLGLARGLYGKPWLFKQIKDYLKTGRYQEMSLADIKKTAIKHAVLAEKMKGKRGLFETRKHLAWYVKGFPGAGELRSKLVRAESVDEVRRILE